MDEMEKKKRPRFKSHLGKDLMGSGASVISNISKYTNLKVKKDNLPLHPYK